MVETRRLLKISVKPGVRVEVDETGRDALLTPQWLFFLPVLFISSCLRFCPNSTSGVRESGQITLGLTAPSDPPGEVTQIASASEEAGLESPNSRLALPGAGGEMHGGPGGGTVFSPLPCSTGEGRKPTEAKQGLDLWKVLGT